MAETNITLTHTFAQKGIATDIYQADITSDLATNDGVVIFPLRNGQILSLDQITVHCRDEVAWSGTLVATLYRCIKTDGSTPAKDDSTWRQVLTANKAISTHFDAIDIDSHCIDAGIPGVEKWFKLKLSSTTEFTKSLDCVFVSPAYIET